MNDVHSPAAPAKEPLMRIGIDLGGTKTEIIVLDSSGLERYRKRIPTDTRSYATICASIVSLVTDAERAIGERCTVGVGIPGTISSHSGLVKNANTNVLNGHPLDKNLSAALGRDVRCMNDANCFALSEAVDGAADGSRTVFAAILGTGCGAGIAIDKKACAGYNLVCGEWGHNPLPWMTAGEFPGPPCWCGKRSCIEKWLSGSGFTEDYYLSISGDAAGALLTAKEIALLAGNGDSAAQQAIERYAGRLARSLAHVINIIDPDIIVLGGGMSNIDKLYDLVPPLLPQWVFGGEVITPIVHNRHGDSSGVRGAAWLWNGQ
jgi:fructokinase